MIKTVITVLLILTGAPAVAGVSVVPATGEAAALNAAVAQGTIGAIQGFLFNYPDGALRTRALRVLYALIPKADPYVPATIDPAQRLPATLRMLGGRRLTYIIGDGND